MWDDHRSSRRFAVNAWRGSMALPAETAVTARRWAWMVRPADAEKHRSLQSASVVARISAQVEAKASSATADLAVRQSTCSVPGGASVSGAGVSLAGASSMTTWALVPENPNELTAARRGAAPRGHSSRRVGMLTAGSPHGGATAPP